MKKSYGLKSLKDPRYDEFERLVIDEKSLPPVLPSNVSYEYLYLDPLNQNALGVCVSYGSAKIFNAFHLKRHGVKAFVSPRAIYAQAKNSYESGDTSDDGLNVSDGLNVIKQYYVLESDYSSAQNTSESDFPLWLEIAPDNLHRTDFVIEEFVTVNNTTEDMKKAMYKNGPFCVGGNFANEWENAGSDGRLQSSNLTVAGGHCYSIIGFDDNFENLDGTKGAWRCSNSWGTDYADKGYMWLPYSIEGTQFFPTDIFTVRA